MGNGFALESRWAIPGRSIVRTSTFPLMTRHHRHTEACKSIARKLEEQLDSKVSRRSAAAIRNHLKQCSNCTAYLDSLKKTILLYRCCPDPHTPARMRQKLLAILHLDH